MSDAEKIREWLSIVETRTREADLQINAEAPNAFSLQEIVLAVERLTMVVEILVKKELTRTPTGG